ncbi:hypothetical protein ACRW9N_10950 [Listeria aquatica]|uniref:hypothetical protein n=1 Tax=Listeria aquatica TaxID=1494960 RepID=UPI003EF5DD74
MFIDIDRESVAMGDDVDSHKMSLQIDSSTTYRFLFKGLLKNGYIPSIQGNNVVWVLRHGGSDLITYQTKEQSFFTRLIHEQEHIIDRMKTSQKDDSTIIFCYYSSKEKRAFSIYQDHNGSKSQMIKNGFMPEYNSYNIPLELEKTWEKKQRF